MEPVECDRGSVWDIFEPVKDSRILVWNTYESGCIERIFVAMLEGQYICRSEGPNLSLRGWVHAKPIPREPKVFWYNKYSNRKVAWHHRYTEDKYLGPYNTKEGAAASSTEGCLGQVKFMEVIEPIELP